MVIGVGEIFAARQAQAMILPDVNVLLYTVNTAVPQNTIARQTLRDAFEQGPVALAWPALLGFLRLATRAGILSQPINIASALEIVQAWLSHPNARLVQPTPQHAGVLARLLIAIGHGGPIVSDAHLAALAIEHRATMLTFDRDFERFAGLRLRLLA